MPAPIIAAGIMAGGGIASSALANRRSREDKALQAQQLRLGNQASDLSKTLAQYAGEQYKLNAPAYAQSLNYYKTLLSGNRSALRSTLAPEISGITDVYRGANRGIERAGLRGASRDMAQADLMRDQAGKISNLYASVRPGAAAQLGQLSSGGIGQAFGGFGQAGAMLGTSGNIYAQAQAAEEARRARMSQGFFQFGGDLANLLMPYFLDSGGRGGSPNLSLGMTGSNPWAGATPSSIMLPANTGWRGAY